MTCKKKVTVTRRVNPRLNKHKPEEVECCPSFLEVWSTLVPLSYEAGANRYLVLSDTSSPWYPPGTSYS